MFNWLKNLWVFYIPKKKFLQNTINVFLIQSDKYSFSSNFVYDLIRYLDSQSYHISTPILKTNDFYTNTNEFIEVVNYNNYSDEKQKEILFEDVFDGYLYCGEWIEDEEEFLEFCQEYPEPKTLFFKENQSFVYHSKIDTLNKISNNISLLIPIISLEEGIIIKKQLEDFHAAEVLKKRINVITIGCYWDNNKTKSKKIKQKIKREKKHYDFYFKSKRENVVKSWLLNLLQKYFDLKDINLSSKNQRLLKERIEQYYRVKNEGTYKIEDKVKNITKEKPVSQKS